MFLCISNKHNTRQSSHRWCCTFFKPLYMYVMYWIDALCVLLVLIVFSLCSKTLYSMYVVMVFLFSLSLSLYLLNITPISEIVIRADVKILGKLWEQYLHEKWNNVIWHYLLVLYIIKWTFQYIHIFNCLCRVCSHLIKNLHCFDWYFYLVLLDCCM